MSRDFGAETVVKYPALN